MDNIIPQQSDGNFTDDQASVEFKGVYEAIERYKIAKNRLLDINHWGDFSGYLSASFELKDAAGNTIHDRLPQEGDYLKIRVPSPEPLREFDWVKIERIDEVNDSDRQQTSIRVRPSSDPASSDRSVDHFFSEAATSTFMVERAGNVLRAEVHGRNEKPNYEHADSIGSGIRNVIMSAGAILGGSGIQWNKLVEGILRFRK